MSEPHTPDLIEFDPRDLSRLARRLEACAEKEDGSAVEARAHNEIMLADQHARRAREARHFANVCDWAYVRLVSGPQKPKRPSVKVIVGTSKHFEAFWESYPRKKSKPDALKAWQTEGCDKIAPVIMAALEKAKRSFDWKKTDTATGQPCAFIPYPASWIRRQGWLDTYSSTLAAQNQTAEVDPPRWREFLKSIKRAYEQHRYAPPHLKSDYREWDEAK
jgi:hypothetical protein